MLKKIVNEVKEKNIISNEMDLEQYKKINDLLNNALGLRSLGEVKFKKVLYKLNLREFQVNDILITSKKFLLDMDDYFTNLLK